MITLKRISQRNQPRRVSSELGFIFTAFSRPGRPRPLVDLGGQLWGSRVMRRTNAQRHRATQEYSFQLTRVMAVTPDPATARQAKGAPLSLRIACGIPYSRNAASQIARTRSWSAFSTA